jgi:hypothetical protein
MLTAARAIVPTELVKVAATREERLLEEVVVARIQTILVPLRVYVPVTIRLVVHFVVA